jgi:hypothetical protein
MMRATIHRTDSQMTGFITVELGRISEDNSLQMRASTSQATIEEYRRLLDDAMESKDPKYPEPVWPFAEPVRLFNVRAVDGLYLIADGFHRVQAAREAGWEWVQATVVDGTVEDATLAAIKSNIGHGLARTTADKRRAVRAALMHPSMAEQSDRDIAKLCGVTHPTVKSVRDEMQEASTWKSLPLGHLVGGWLSLPDVELRQTVAQFREFRHNVTWACHAHGVSDQMISRRIGIAVAHVERILRPLATTPPVPSCIDNDDRQLWLDTLRAWMVDSAIYTITDVMSYPDMPSDVLRADLKKLQNYRDLLPSPYASADATTDAFMCAAWTAGRVWQDTGMIDSESVRLEMESMLTYLTSEEHQLWAENRQQEVAIG